MAAQSNAKSNTNSGAKTNRTGTGRSGSTSSSSGTASRGRSSGNRGTGRSAGSRANANHAAETTRSRTSRIINDDDEKALSPARKREITFFIYLAVAVFLLCSNFGICGAVGRVFGGFFFGLWGWCQYLVPFYIIAAAAFFLANGPKKSLIRRFIWIGVILLITSWIFQLSYGTENQTISTLYNAGYDEHRGGGVIFGGIMLLFYKMIGKVGVIILMVLLSIVAVIQITGVSLLQMVKNIFSVSYRGDNDEEDEDEDYEVEERRPRVAHGRRLHSENDLRVLPKNEEGFGEPSVEGFNEYDSGEYGDSDKNELGKSKKKRGRKQAKYESAYEESMHEVIPEEDELPDPYHDDMEELKEVARRKVASTKSAAEKGASDEEITRIAEGRPKVVPSSQERGLNIPSPATVGRGITNPARDAYLAGRNTPAGYDPKKDSAFADTSKKPVDFFELKPQIDLGGDWDDEPSSYGRYSDEDPKKNTFTTEASSTSPMDTEADYPEDEEDIYIPGSVEIGRTGDSSGERSTSRSSASSGAGSSSPVSEAGGSGAGASRTGGPSGKAVTHADTLDEMAKIEENLAARPEPPKKKPYRFPPISLLAPIRNKGPKSDQDVRDTAMKLKNTLESFGVSVTITDYSRGPAVTRYELTPEVGVKVSKILSLQDDIKLSLAAADIRIEAPIPGKSAIGIEVPNKEKQMVGFRELMEYEGFKNAKSKLAFALGKDIGGQIIVGDVAKMPHVLIAGATGSGKSVCLSTIIMSILYKAKPEEVRFIMIDPKQVELTAYNGIPHMLIPVVTDAKKAAGALNWAVQEMEKRYKLFARYNVRNIEGFNKKVDEENPDPEDLSKADLRFMPQIVVIIDELADLMMVAHGEVEEAIVRLSQLARAAGIHLVIATQRPSVDVITGLIKANVPSRIALSVSSGTDSRTILDMVGAEKLLGKGDMLYSPSGMPKPLRVQGAYIDDDEIVSVTDFIKNQCGDAEYDESITQSIDSGAVSSGSGSGAAAEEEERFDEYFEEAGRLVIEKDKASIGYLQRVFKIGFNRAARIMDQLSEAGVVGPEEGTKPRKVLMTMDEFEDFMSV